MITVYGFKRVRDFVIGETRDLRALWALEETGLPYLVHGLDYIEGETQTNDYRRISPFSQVPVIDDDGFIVAETGAIVIYIAEKAGMLIPADLKGRSRVTQWCCTALNTIEPTLLQIRSSMEAAKRRQARYAGRHSLTGQEKNLPCSRSSYQPGLILQVTASQSRTS